MSIAAMIANASHGGCLRQPDRHGSNNQPASYAALTQFAPEPLSRPSKQPPESRRQTRVGKSCWGNGTLSHLADLCSGALSDGDVGRDPEPPWSSPSGTVTRLRSYRRPDSQADEKSAMPDTALLHCPAASAMARHLRNCEAAASAVRHGVIAAARIGATSEVRPHSSPASSRLPRSEKGSAPSRSCIVTKGRCNTSVHTDECSPASMEGLIP